MSSQSMTATAFVLSLIGGLIIILSSVLTIFWSTSGWPWYGGMMGSWMGGFGYGYNSGLTFGFSMVALISGIIVVVGAIMLSARPAEHVAWGAIVLIFSVVSFLGMGGFFIGAILGIAGGALALSFRAPTKT